MSNDKDTLRDEYPEDLIKSGAVNRALREYVSRTRTAG